MQASDRSLQLLILLPLPLAYLAVGALVRVSIGTHWALAGGDPDYAYLLNALNVSEFKMVGHSDHPGFTVHMLGGAILALVRLVVFNGADTGLANNVLAQPEQYLDLLTSIVKFAIAAVLFFLGLAARSCRLSWPVALTLQASPFLLPSSLWMNLGRFTPEPILYLVGLLLALHAVITVFGSQEQPDGRSQLVAGVLLAAGVITKVIFAPWLLFELIIARTFKARGTLIVSFLVGLMLLLLPFYRLFSRMMNWFLDLATHTGRYGGGPEGFVDANLFAESLFALFSIPQLMYPIVTSILLLFLSAICRPYAPQTRNASRIILGSLSLMVCQTIIVAKSPAMHYLLPGLTSTGLMLSSGFILADSCGKRSQLLSLFTKSLVYTVIVFLVINNIMNLRDQSSSKIPISEAASITPMFSKLSGVNQDCALVYESLFGFGTVDKIHALFLGDIWSDFRQADRLAVLYPTSYRLAGSTFTSWGGVETFSPQDLVSKYQCIVVQGQPTLAPFEHLGDIHYSITTLFPGPPWPVYRLDLP
jgi:hypothetical protein